MKKYIPAYFASMFAMFVLDLIWLSQIAKPMYANGIGHLMSAEPKLQYAAIFYCVYVFGLMWYALRPNNQTKGVKKTFLAGALFGFFVYASYDFTNLALLKDWPLGMSLIDLAWGISLSGVTAAIGKLAFDRTAKL